MINWDLSYALFPVVIMFIILLMNETVSLTKMFAVFTFSMISAVPSSLLETIGTWAVTHVYINLGLNIYSHYPLIKTSYSALIAFLVISLTEEMFKLLSFRIVSDKVHDIYSAIIYGATAALGFAALENVLYVTNAATFSIVVAGLRTFLSIPIHTVTGIIIGLAFVNDGKRKKADRLILFTLCVLLHGTYDFLLETIGDYSNHSLMVMVCLAGIGTVVLITYAILISLIITMKKRHKADRRIHLLVDNSSINEQYIKTDNTDISINDSNIINIEESNIIVRKAEEIV